MPNCNRCGCSLDESEHILCSVCRRSIMSWAMKNEHDDLLFPEPDDEEES